MKENFKFKTFLALTSVHLLSLGAIFCYSVEGLILFFIFSFLVGCFGITLGYHRLLTHKGLKTSNILKRILATVGCLAWQGDPIWWVAVHRLHHKDTDKSGKDPHTPKDGFWWSHITWAWYKQPQLRTENAFKKYSRDLYSDPYMIFLRQGYGLVNLTFLAVLFMAGLLYGGLYYAFSFLCYAGFLRIFWALHSTWMVNSVCHIWGYKNYATNDTSVNNPIVAMLTWGEGWHNNHHYDQISARHGHKWWEFDITYQVIRLLKKFNLVWDVKV